MISMFRRRLGPGIDGSISDSDPVPGYLLKYPMFLADLEQAIGDVLFAWGPAKPECRSLVFDGVDEYITKDVDTGKFSGKQDAFTLTFWAKFDAVNAATDQVIFQYGTDSAAGTGFSVKVVQNTSTVRFTSNGTTTDVTAVAGKWFLYVITVSAGTRKAYINNGVPVTESKAVNTFSGTTVRVAANSTPGAFFKGAIDDIRFYGSALSSGDIQKLWDYYCNELTFEGEILTFENDPLTFDWRGL